MVIGLSSAKKTLDEAHTIMEAPVATGADLLEKLDLSPEERLLLLCARLQLSQDQREELAGLVAGPMDWEQVLYKARWHNLTPLVFHNLNGIGEPGEVPPTIMDRLKSAYRSNVVLNLHRQRELRRVQEVLEAQGVPVILLKGAALAGTVYQDIGLRPMGDLDILVPEYQAAIAQEAVQSLGFGPAGFTDGNHRHLPRLQREGTAAQVEVHRHIVNRDTRLYFDIQGFWSRAREVPIARRWVRVLAPEDLLIHLAVNFFQDRRFKSAVALRQLCDIAETLRFYQDSISWPLFLENVRDYDMTGPVGCVLYLARGLLDAPLPEEVARQLWPKGLDEHQLERFARRRVLDTEGWVAHALVEPGKNYGLTSVAAAVLRRLFPSRQALAERYQRPASRSQWLVMYLSFLREGTRILCESITRPAGVREDLAIDRWHHAMYGSGNGPGKEH